MGKIKPKHIGVRFVLSWLFSVLFILIGALSMLDSILGGLLILIGAVIILPPFAEFVEKEYRLHLSGWLRLILFLVLVGIGILLTSTTEDSAIPDVIEQQPETSEESIQTAETSSAPQLSDVGDFKVLYYPLTNPDYLEYEKIFKEAQLFENKAQFLNDGLILPYDITITLEECGTSNAFYDPNTKQIIICYELMDHFAEVFYDSSDTNAELGTAMLNSMDFVFYHELGHVLVDVYDLPTTGNPEDNADQVSTLVLLGEGQSGINALLDGANWFFIVSEESDVEESAFSGIHSPDKRRYYNLLCWIYGSDPQNGEYLITGWELPEDRASVCEDEYIKMSNSWDRLLSSHRKN